MIRSVSFNLISIFLTLFLGNLAFESNAQVTYQRTIGPNTSGGSYGQSILKISDNNYLVCGRRLDGSISSSVYLLNIDVNGDTIWTKTYGGPSADEGSSVGLTADGGFIVAGNTLSFGAGGRDFYLIRTDSMGDTIWTSAYGGALNDKAHAVKQTTDGGFIVVGETTSFGSGPYSMYTLKLNTNGDLLWTHVFSRAGFDFAVDVQETSDGGYAVLGYTDNAGVGTLFDISLIKLNSLGDTLWTRIYGTNRDEQARSLELTADGGFIVCGFGRDSLMNSPEMLLMKLDSVGSLQWTKTYGGVDSDYAEEVKETTDGGYILFGYRFVTFTESHLLMIKTNSIGDTLWTRLYDNLYSARAYSGLQANDGGYVMTGELDGTSTHKVIIMRTDSFGLSDCLHASYPISMNSVSLSVASGGASSTGGTRTLVPTNNYSNLTYTGIACYTCIETILIPANISCIGYSDGEIDLVLSGGGPPYSYIWSTGDTTQDITGLSAGFYQVTITDSIGCYSIDSAIITEPAAILDSLSADICSGDSILLEGMYQTLAGTYYDTFVSANGCDSIVSTDLAVLSVALVSFSGLDSSYCIGDVWVTDTLIGSPVGGAFSGPGMTGNVFDPFSTGFGTFSITYSFTDGNGCNDSTSQNVEVTNCSAIGEVQSAWNVRVYPNPTTGIFNIELEGTMDTDLELRIFNSLGQEVAQPSYANDNGKLRSEVDLREYPIGVYTIRILSDSEIFTRQIIVE